MTSGFEMTYESLGILAGLLLPILPGCLAVELLAPALKKRKTLHWIFGLFIGHALLSSMAYTLWWAVGMRIGPSLHLFVFGTLCLFLRVFHRRSSADGNIRLLKSGDKTMKSGNETLDLIKTAGAARFQRSIFVFLIALSIIYFVIVGITTFTERVSDWPGVGIYGLKAKIIQNTGSCAELFTNKEIAYSHPEYPLGFALMIAWCCALGGGFDDSLMKIIPLFWGVIAFLTIYQVGKSISGKRNLSLLFALFVASTTTYLNCCIKMYAETIMITAVVSAFYCLTRFLTIREISCERRGAGTGAENDMAAWAGSSFPVPRKTGWLLIGLLLLIFSCWYKTEGALYLFSAMVGLLAFGFRDIRGVFKRDGRIVVFVIGAAILLAPVFWYVAQLRYGLQPRDFSITNSAISTLKPFSPGWNKIADEISGAFRHEYLLNKYNAGIFCGFMALTLLSLGRKDFYKPPVIQKHFTRNRHIYFVVFCAVSVIAVFHLSFFFSTMPLWWHLQSVKRILMLPNLLICLAMLSIPRFMSAQNPRFPRIVF